ncbi:alpha/beta hydrolase [Bacillus methanolicus]|uniref:alpha/beta fold hydrolase n=1 Tax=Bacillus methanolicus TaxID=1471 RepID=UPI00200CA339|nr:alpha/beta hydrolase [Bacillus methanolicus]UQD51893.1 alpha/beta hydrolase [Bacillus methanolicus]
MKPSYLVMLPGWGMEQAAFQPLIDSLSKVFQLSFVEWRGVKSPNDFRERVEETIISIQEPVFLLGWSLGSLAALEFAITYPNSVKGLILIAGTSRFTSCEHYSFGWHPRIVERMKKQLQRNKEKTLADFYDSMFSESEKEAGFFSQFAEIVQRKFQGDDIFSLITGLDYLLQKDMRVRIGQIKTSCLLIHGKKDVICPIEASSFIGAKLGDKSIFYVLEDAGHVPFFTKLEKCVQLITNFVQKEVDT